MSDTNVARVSAETVRCGGLLDVDEEVSLEDELVLLVFLVLNESLVLQAWENDEHVSGE